MENPLRILVVEDFSTMRQIIRNRLNDLGCDDVTEAVQAGVNGYVIKPFTAETVQAKLDNMLAPRPGS